MSRHTPPTDTLGKESDRTRATTPQDASGCLTSWFAEGKNNKTCPDCRAPVKSQPAPAYLVRAVVQLFTSRAELLDKGETTEQHRAHQNEEAERLEADKKNRDPKEGGLFRGIFNQTRQRPAQPIYDLEDGVVRCPYCAHELEADDCLNCGYRNDDSLSDVRSDSENSEMTDDPYAEIDDDGFGEAPGSDSAEWYDDDLTTENYPGIQRLPTGFRLQSFPGFGNVPGGMARAIYEHFHGHSDFDSHGSTHEDDDDEMDDEEDEDMDSFIDDEEQPEDYDSDSDRDTVVGRSEYGGTQLRTILDSSPGSRYSSAQSNIYDFDTMLDSDEDGTSDEGEDEDGNENEDEELEDDDGEEEEEEEEEEEDDDDDDDDDDEPIRPSVARSRRTTYQILSSSSPLRVNSAPATSTCSRPQPPAAGLSAASAISLDDDSDEGPVGPATRRARARPAAA
ncbi:hypothetical protein AN4455.2 [Aspergillus nidulans FGSC A4]|uniref:Uncharacterized protein n=1 Tax=Emericella nidulans (strain FGSC A4 / ATCC 38163 / CBS 112.46 / NRRL 194 / M139) TaxID=227321 RepID=Q5B4S5_EMENI|nr:hypothetical protein [Aspergillus nidulans FGSC A4]EAA60220.1 hypothetical protein AN4455.2 [Aspergillus nidulans FGSC A4]CBF77485.1 TPA: hypothetical protein ANIA_04455 [Aspergillus nidulans FGSC A4]|eukprot:XP_662059.1 hypothetical protein AN4455.2 [Aspergillus nidulans FGSC A4]